MHLFDKASSATHRNAMVKTVTLHSKPPYPRLAHIFDNSRMLVKLGAPVFRFLDTVLLLVLLSILLLVLLPTSSVFGAGKWNDPHDYYQSATRSSGDLLRNVEKFHLPQGLEKMNKKKYDRALEDFDFVLRYYPNHPKGLLFMSEVSRRMKKPEIAEKYFQKAFTMYPGYANTHSIYGIFLQKTDRIEKAIEQYKVSLKLKPNASETHYNLGLALHKTGIQDEALVHAKRAYELGYPLPGLRNKLIKAGIWKKPTPPKAASDVAPSVHKEPLTRTEPSENKEPSAHKESSTNNALSASEQPHTQ